MKKEQAAFAERLRIALADADIAASPAELEKLLARHGGVSVTAQAISGWLTGKSLPRQGHLRALAALLDIEPHVLQFGDASGRSVRETRAKYPAKLKGPDRLTFDAFLALPADQRKLVGELIRALAQPPPRNPRRSG